jgi:hypothetical protein
VGGDAKPEDDVGRLDLLLTFLASALKFAFDADGFNHEICGADRLLDRFVNPRFNLFAEVTGGELVPITPGSV